MPSLLRAGVLLAFMYGQTEALSDGAKKLMLLSDECHLWYSPQECPQMLGATQARPSFDELADMYPHLFPEVRGHPGIVAGAARNAHVATKSHTTNHDCDYEACDESAAIGAGDTRTSIMTTLTGALTRQEAAGFPATTGGVSLDDLDGLDAACRLPGPHGADAVVRDDLVEYR